MFLANQRLKNSASINAFSSNARGHHPRPAVAFETSCIATRCKRVSLYWPGAFQCPMLLLSPEDEITQTCFLGLCHVDRFRTCSALTPERRALGHKSPSWPTSHLLGVLDYLARGVVGCLMQCVDNVTSFFASK